MINMNRIISVWLQELKSFNCVETRVILLYKQISSNSFKNKFTYKLFTYKSYMYSHLNKCEQMTDVKLLLVHSSTWNYLTVCKQTINSK